MDTTLLEKKISNTVGLIKESDCSGDTKEKICQAISQCVEEYIPRSHTVYNENHFNTLKSEGIVALDELTLTPNVTDEILTFLKSKPVFNGHVPAQSDGITRYLHKGARAYSFGSYAFQDILLCPHLLELALNPHVLALVEHYLGCTPTIYSFNTWWSFPGHKATVSQDYHRDLDDFKFLALFIYLTDVTGHEAGGQHRFITHTHDDAQLLTLLGNNQTLANTFYYPHLRANGYYQAKQYEKYFSQQIKDITGKAGSIFLADTYGFHKGVPPKTQDRLVCWIRYGLRKNLTYGNDLLTPVATDAIKDRIDLNERNQYMLRLLISDHPSSENQQHMEALWKKNRRFSRRLRNQIKALVPAGNVKAFLYKTWKNLFKRSGL